MGWSVFVRIASGRACEGFQKLMGIGIWFCGTLESNGKVRAEGRTLRIFRITFFEHKKYRAPLS